MIRVTFVVFCKVEIRNIKFTVREHIIYQTHMTGEQLHVFLIGRTRMGTIGAQKQCAQRAESAQLKAEKKNKTSGD